MKDKNINNEESYYTASQWQLMWRRFRKHKLAMSAMCVIILFYLVVVFATFISPYDPNTRFSDYVYTPPQRIHFFNEGQFKGPFVYGLNQELNIETFSREYKTDKDRIYPVKLFFRGKQYKLWGIFETNIHLFGSEGPLFLFGTDKLGRDLFSRIISGTRISLSIGLVGVFLSLILGIIIGGISGYFGGFIDDIIQRIIELLLSIPKIPLWMGLSAALPSDWSVTKTFFAITIILSFISWTGLARVVRGKFLSLREEDFIVAAELIGCSRARIVGKHLLPSFLSYIIVSLTLSIPQMILGETALSFLGLGMQPPAISWGVLLQSAQDMNAIANQPWILIPCIFVIVVVLMFNFLGDGVRDAADPYSQ